MWRRILIFDVRFWDLTSNFEIKNYANFIVWFRIPSSDVEFHRQISILIARFRITSLDFEFDCQIFGFHRQLFNFTVRILEFIRQLSKLIASFHIYSSAFEFNRQLWNLIFSSRISSTGSGFHRQNFGIQSSSLEINRQLSYLIASFCI